MMASVSIFLICESKIVLQVYIVYLPQWAIMKIKWNSRYESTEISQLYIILFVRPMDVHEKENQYFLNSVYS